MKQPPTDPYGLSLKWLALRELTERQLRQRLAARQVPGGSIDEVVRTLQSNGTLDDRRTALAAARTDALVKRHGRFRVSQHLAALGIDRLAVYAERALATVPQDSRVLVTAHDAFNYFGRAYGYEVVGIQADRGTGGR